MSAQVEETPVTTDQAVQLETPLPESLPAGRPTAVFVKGTRAGRAFWEMLAVEAPADLGDLGRVEASDPPRPSETGASLAICMATFEPDPELFQRQVDSLREQTDTDWVCVISDDCSGAEHFESIRRVVGDDERFLVSRSDERLGFYGNFERALTLIPPDARLVALCDQDDRWYPDKLATLRAALGDAQLVYSDQRLTDRDGRVLRDTMWRGRRNNATNLASMLVANTITGAASLMRREVAELALPFPEPPGFRFHDHWIAVAALASGDVAYVDRPLYDYVQHSGAVFGDVSSGRRLAPTLRRPREVLRRWRAAYFYGFANREVYARTVLLRCSSLEARKRATLERFAAGSSATAAWLLVRPLRALTGRTETLGSDAQLGFGVLWGLVARRTDRLDTTLPAVTDFEQQRLRRWRARL